MGSELIGDNLTLVVVGGPKGPCVLLQIRYSKTIDILHSSDTMISFFALVITMPLEPNFFNS